jgi:hypothetical protein
MDRTFFFRVGGFVDDAVEQVAARHQLGHDVKRRPLVERLVAFDDVRVVHLAKQLRLLVQPVQIFLLQLTLSTTLDRILLPRRPMRAQLDDGKRTAAQILPRRVVIVCKLGGFGAVVRQMPVRNLLQVLLQLSKREMCHLNQ